MKLNLPEKYKEKMQNIEIEKKFQIPINKVIQKYVDMYARKPAILRKKVYVGIGNNSNIVREFFEK